MFKDTLATEKYLLLNIPRRLRVILSKFRISNHDLECEQGRYSNCAKEDRVCKLCQKKNIHVYENEFHVLFECSEFQEIRTLYIDEEYLAPKNLFTFRKLMKNDDPS